MAEKSGCAEVASSILKVDEALETELKVSVKLLLNCELSEYFRNDKFGENRSDVISIARIHD